MNFKILFLDIKQSIKKLGHKDREDLYQCTRKYWRLSPERANQAEYVVGFADEEIKTIYKVSKWRKVGDCQDLLNDEEVKQNPDYIQARYAFEGERLKEKVFKRIAAEITKDIPKSSQNPIHYNY